MYFTYLCHIDKAERPNSHDKFAQDVDASLVNFDLTQGTRPQVLPNSVL